MVACGGGGGEQVDDTKTQLYVSNYDGGFGDEWLYSAKAKFEKLYENKSFEDGKTVKSTNHSGGILGGMSDGSDIVFRAAFKPTPSISSPQQTVDINGNSHTIEIKGRHDPVIVPRAVIVVEAMAAITLTDLIFSNMFSRIENIQKVYTK